MHTHRGSFVTQAKAVFILTCTGLTFTPTVDQKVTKDSVSDEKENEYSKVSSIRGERSLQSHNGGIILTGIGFEVLSGAGKRRKEHSNTHFVFAKGKVKNP